MSGQAVLGGRETAVQVSLVDNTARPVATKASEGGRWRGRLNPGFVWHPRERLAVRLEAECWLDDRDLFSTAGQCSISWSF